MVIVQDKTLLGAFQRVERGLSAFSVFFSPFVSPSASLEALQASLLLLDSISSVTSCVLFTCKILQKEHHVNGHLLEAALAG